MQMYVLQKIFPLVYISSMRKVALNLFILLLYYEFRSYSRSRFTVNSELQSSGLRSVFSNTQLSRAEWRVKETMCAKYLIEHRPLTFGTYHQNKNRRYYYSTSYRPASVVNAQCMLICIVLKVLIQLRYCTITSILQVRTLSNRKRLSNFCHFP